MTRQLQILVVVIVLSPGMFGQALDPPVEDRRVAANTLVREDIFAGFLQKDLTRLARAERNIDLLLSSRPDNRAPLLAWKADTALTRAVNAIEGNDPKEFRLHYSQALDLYAEAKRLAPDSIAILSITGGAQVSLADRLPASERAASWELAYQCYRQLRKLEDDIDTLPAHFKGEVLSGLAESAQRTGRVGEVDATLDEMLTLLPNTPYAIRATQWKNDASARSNVKLTCQTCHLPGTLASRLAAISK